MDYKIIKTKFREAQWYNNIDVQIKLCNKYKNSDLFKIIYDTYQPGLLKYYYIKLLKEEYSISEMDFILAFLESYVNTVLKLKYE